MPHIICNFCRREFFGTTQDATAKDNGIAIQCPACSGEQREQQCQWCEKYTMNRLHCREQKWVCCDCADSFFIRYEHDADWVDLRAAAKAAFDEIDHAADGSLSLGTKYRLEKALEKFGL